MENRWISTTCLLLLWMVTTGVAQTKPARGAPAWRAAFDQAYALREGEVIRHVPQPFIPERLEFYRAEARGQAQAAPEGPTSMTVGWHGNRPLFDGARFSGGGDAMTLRQVLEGVIDLRPHEYAGPRDLLDMELPGDWSVRADAKKPDLLAGLAKHLSAITARDLSFVHATEKPELIVASGQLKLPDDVGEGDMWRLELALDEVELLRPFGGAGPPEHLFNTLTHSTGWPVLNETTPPPRQVFLSWGGGRMTEEENLDRISREHLDKLLGDLSKVTGLQLKVEQREVARWKLTERE